MDKALAKKQALASAALQCAEGSQNAKGSQRVDDSLGVDDSSGSVDDSRRSARKKSLMHPLNFIATDFRDRVRQGLKDRGHQLQPAHSAVIIHLKLEGSRLTELAERAGVSKQAMGKMIDELEEIGYVEKASDPEDGRAKMIRFTDKGLVLLQDSGEIVDEIWSDYSAMVGEKRLLTLRDELLDLQQHILAQRSE